jgi:hypothetical protein
MVQARLRELGYQIEANWPLTQFRYPALGLVLYLLTIKVFQPSKNEEQQYEKNLKSDKDAQAKAARCGKTKSFMFVHNALLCVFSLLCCLNTAPIVYSLLRQYGWEDTVCNHLQKIYEGPYGFWSHLFYLSKFYEFIDTWIVIARGRRPITLQVYHHMGAVLGMWMITVTKSTGGFFFVVFNSFIHTIMYFYYASSTLGLQFSGKFIITILQMVQFLTGNSLVTAQLLLWHKCMRLEDKICIVYHVVYTSVLFYMFYQFYKQSYKKKSAKKEIKSE